MMDLKLYKRPLAALTVTGDKVRVTPGLLSKLGHALSVANINVYCVSMGEYSVSFFVEETDHEKARDALHAAVDKTSLDALSLLRNIGMITVTGQELIDSPGMLRHLIDPIARSGINLLTVSSSFDSIIVFVTWNDARKTYELIENRFLKGL